MTQLGINGLQPGFKYDVRVRGIFDGQAGEWSPTYEIDVFSDTSSGTLDKAPNPPTGLSIVPTVDSFIIKWTAPTRNVDGTVLTDMKDYVLEISNDGGAADVTYNIPEHNKPIDLSAKDQQHQFEFTYKMNIDVFTTPVALIFVKIYSRDNTNNRSATALSGNATNTAPTAPVLGTPTAYVNGIGLTWTAASNDTVEYVLRSHTSSMANPPVTGTEIFRGNSLAFNHQVTGALRYYRVGAVDIFGQTTWSNEVSATPAVAAGDTTPPGPPTAAGTTNTWKGTSYIINWVAPADGDVVRYRIDIRNDANTDVKTFYSEGTRFELTLENNIDAFGTVQLDPFYVRVWSIDAAGNLSSTYYEITAANTVAAPAHPGPPTVATPVLDAAGIYLSWPAVTDTNGIIDRYEIYGVTTSPTAVVWTGTGTSFKYPLTGAYSGVYYFRARTIDKFGRAGSYSSPQVSIDATTFLAAPTATGAVAFDTNDLSNRTAQITVSSITPPASPYLHGVKIRYKKSSDTNYTEIDLGKSTAAYIIRGLAVGVAYSVEIASYDLQGRVGAWGNVTGTPFTQAVDTTVSAPTLVTLTTSVGAVSVGWTGVSDTDVINSMGRYDVEICDVNTFNNATLQKQSIPGGPASAVMAASFTGLTPGTTRYARVRTYDAIGNPSPAWVTSSPASVTVASTVDTVVPGPPTSPANEWKGTSYLVRWTAPAGGTNADVVRYRIEIRNDANTLSGTFYATGTNFELTLAENLRVFTTAQVDPTYVRIWSIDSWGNESATYAELNAAATTAAPAHPGHPTPVLKIDAAGIFVSWPISDPNNIIDYYEVYGPGTGSTNLLWKGSGSSFKYALPSAYSGLYYFRIQAKDKFGRPTTAAYGTEASINSTTVLAAPTFSTASAFDTYDPTNRTAQITLSAITPPSSPELSGMKIRYKKNADVEYTEVDVAKETTTYIIRGLAVGVQYNISMASYDLQGRLSAWSAAANVTKAADTGVNGATSPVLSAANRGVNVTWVGSSDTDIINGWGRYDVDIATDAGFTANVRRQTFPGGAAASVHSASFTGLTTVPYYARVITTDANGNTATIATSPTNVTPTATTTDGAVPGSSPAATVTVPVEAQSLIIKWPEVTNNDPVTYDLYRHTSTGFTPPGTGTLAYSGSGTAYIDKGLTGGTTYYYRIIARDKDGSSVTVGTEGSGTPKTYTSDGVAPASSPAATVTIPAEAKALVIKWPEVANNDPVTYDLYRHTTTPFTPPGTGTLVYSGLGTAYTDRGLTGGTPYYYRVIARDKDGSAAVGTQGTGTPTAYASDGTAPASSPAATVTVPAVAQSLVIKWTEVANGDPVTYDLYRHTASGFTPPGTGTLVYSGLGTAYTDNGLTGGTPYYYRIIARDRDGSAAVGTQGTGTPRAYTSDGTAPASSPTATVSLPTAAQSLVIKWTEVANNDPVTYDLYRHTTSGFAPPGTGTLVYSGLGTAYTDTGLTAGTPYYYRIIARDKDGSAAVGTQGTGTPKSYASDNVVPSTSPAATVTVPTASRSLVVTWPLISNADPVTYNLYRHTSSPFTPPVTGTLVYSGAGTSFTDTGLAGSTQYWYRVIASDADGPSAVVGTVGTGTAKSYQSDGIAPSTSPTPTIHGGVNYLAVSWDKVDNADPLIYEVHVSDVPGTPPFTPSAATLFAEVRGTLAYINKLADGSPLAYFEDDGVTNKPYYVRIIAKDDDGAAAAGTQVSATMAQVGQNDVAANTITADMIFAATMTTQNFSAIDSLIQNLIMGDLNSQHVEADADGLRVIDGNGNLLVDLPTDPTKRPKFNGDLIAQNLEVIGATILGTTTIGQGTSLELQASQAAPGSSPAVTIGYPSTINFGGAGAAQKEWFGLAYTTQGGALGTLPCFYSARPNTQGYWQHVEEYNASTGALNRTFSLPVSAYDIWGITAIGAQLYILYKNTLNGTYILSKYNLSNFGFVSNANITATLTSARPGLGTNGTDLFVVCGASKNGNASLRTIRYNTSLVLQNNVTHSAMTVDTLEDGSGGRTTEFGGVLWHAASSRWFIAMYSYEGANLTRRKVYSFSGTITTTNGLTYTVQDDFFGSQGAEADGITSDGTSIYTILDSSPLTKHTDWTWDTTTATALYWVGFSWYDSAGTVQETTISPRTTITARKRAGLKVTTTTLPGSGGAQEPNSHRVYINRSAHGTTTEPQASGRFDGRLQGTYTPETNVITSFNSGGAQNLATSSFTGGVGAKIRGASLATGTQGSTAQDGWSIDGSGSMQGIHPNIQIFEFTGTAGTVGTTGAAANISGAQTQHTWYKPINAGYTEVEMLIIAGGGGGGGGARINTTDPARGGGGGAGGSVMRVTLPIGALSSTEVVKVGGGGGGGGGRTANNDGIVGGDGGFSSVSVAGNTDYFKAGAGLGGAGGAAGSLGGIGGDSGPSQGWQHAGGQGALGGDGGHVASFAGGNVPGSSGLRQGAPGGGGAGGYNAGAFDGASGGHVVLVGGGSGGGVGGSAAGNGTSFGTAAGANSRPLVGGAGGGGGGRVNATAGNGGSGGIYGAGGGGGGGAGGGSSATSGNGGPGAKGIVVITCR